MIKRWQESNLRMALETRRGVHLTGARQCGKTTLSVSLSGIDFRYLSLDVPALRHAAVADPDGFIARPDGKTLVVDEVQKAPEILDAIKIRLDRDGSKGQYLLTGSSSLRFAKMVKDSLAGRLATIRLRTLALGELKGGSGNFLKRAFLRDFTGGFDQLDKRMVIHLAFQGGYPETLDFSPKARKGWYRDYVDDLLMKDIRDVTEIRKTEALLKVVDWMLAYTAKIFDRKTLCTAAQLSGVTIDNYLGALGALYLFDAVPAWAGSDYAKIGKRVKYFASDPGLVANQLGWKEEQVYLDGDRSGKLVETWVYHELAAISGLNQEYTITQYRDSDKHEIDFIVENDDRDLLGIEVKAGSNLGPEDFKHLKWFSAKMSKSRFTGIVLYTGKDVLRFGEGFYAVPMAMLAV